MAFAWITILAFLRIGTDPRALQAPFTTAEALATVSKWLDRSNVVVLGPTERHWGILRDLAVNGQARGALLSDAHLAALAIEHGAVLATTDRDFARFPGLRVVDPLRV